MVRRSYIRITRPSWSHGPMKHRFLCFWEKTAELWIVTREKKTSMERSRILIIREPVSRTTKLTQMLRFCWATTLVFVILLHGLFRTDHNEVRFCSSPSRFVYPTRFTTSNMKHDAAKIQLSISVYTVSKTTRLAYSCINLKIGY